MTEILFLSILATRHSIKFKGDKPLCVQWQIDEKHVYYTCHLKQKLLISPLVVYPSIQHMPDSNIMYYVIPNDPLSDNILVSIYKENEIYLGILPKMSADDLRRIQLHCILIYNAIVVLVAELHGENKFIILVSNTNNRQYSYYQFTGSNLTIHGVGVIFLLVYLGIVEESEIPYLQFEMKKEYLEVLGLVFNSLKKNVIVIDIYEHNFTDEKFYIESITDAISVSEPFLITALKSDSYCITMGIPSGYYICSKTTKNRWFIPLEYLLNTQFHFTGSTVLLEIEDNLYMLPPRESSSRFIIASSNGNLTQETYIDIAPRQYMLVYEAFEKPLYRINSAIPIVLYKSPTHLIHLILYIDMLGKTYNLYLDPKTWELPEKYASLEWHLYLSPNARTTGSLEGSIIRYEKKVGYISYKAENKQYRVNPLHKDIVLSHNMPIIAWNHEGIMNMLLCVLEANQDIKVYWVQGTDNLQLLTIIQEPRHKVEFTQPENGIYPRSPQLHIHPINNKVVVYNIIKDATRVQKLMLSFVICCGKPKLLMYRTYSNLPPLLQDLIDKEIWMQNIKEYNNLIPWHDTYFALYHINTHSPHVCPECSKVAQFEPIDINTNKSIVRIIDYRNKTRLASIQSLISVRSQYLYQYKNNPFIMTQIENTGYTITASYPLIKRGCQLLEVI